MPPDVTGGPGRSGLPRELELERAALFDLPLYPPPPFTVRMSGHTQRSDRGC